MNPRIQSYLDLLVPQLNQSGETGFSYPGTVMRICTRDNDPQWPELHTLGNLYDTPAIEVFRAFHDADVVEADSGMTLEQALKMALVTGKIFRSELNPYAYSLADSRFKPEPVPQDLQTAFKQTVSDLLSNVQCGISHFRSLIRSIVLREDKGAVGELTQSQVPDLTFLYMLMQSGIRDEFGQNVLNAVNMTFDQACDIVTECEATLAELYPPRVAQDIVELSGFTGEDYVLKEPDGSCTFVSGVLAQELFNLMPDSQFGGMNGGWEMMSFVDPKEIKRGITRPPKDLQQRLVETYANGAPLVVIEDGFWEFMLLTRPVNDLLQQMHKVADNQLETDDDDTMPEMFKGMSYQSVFGDSGEQGRRVRVNDWHAVLDLGDKVEGNNDNQVYEGLMEQRRLQVADLSDQ